MTAPDYTELIRTLMWDSAAYLTEWEAQFLNSLNAWVENAPLTPKQIAKLQQIETRIHLERDPRFMDWGTTRPLHRDHGLGLEDDYCIGDHPGY
jgi:hypothetical protein